MPLHASTIPTQLKKIFVAFVVTERERREGGVVGIDQTYAFSYTFQYLQSIFRFGRGAISPILTSDTFFMSNNNPTTGLLGLLGNDTDCMFLFLCKILLNLFKCNTIYKGLFTNLDII